MELKFRHILAILRALDVEPSVFFQTLYPEDRPPTDAVVMEEFLRRFQKLGFGAQPTPPPTPGINPQELERMIQSAVRAALTGMPGADQGRSSEESAQGDSIGSEPRGGRGPRGGKRPKS